MPTFTRFATDETLSAAEMRGLIESGKVAATTLLQRSDSTDWKPAGEFEELKSAFQSAPKPPVRGKKVLTHFEAKFTEPPPAPKTMSETTGYRLFGIFWVLISAFAVFSTSPARLSDPAELMNTAVFALFGIIGVLLVIHPDALRNIKR